MLTRKELEKSPLFQNISYEEYMRMFTCFQAVERSFRPEELIYDFADSSHDSVGIVEHGRCSLIRIDESGTSTVMEELAPAAFSAVRWPLPGQSMTVWRSSAVPPARCCSLTTGTFSSAVRTPVCTTACWCRICCAS